MIAVILRTIRDRWKMLLAICVIGMGTQLMYISLFPSFKTSQINYDDLMKQMPEAFKKVINMESFSMDTIEKYLTMEMYSMFWLILTIIFCLSLGGTGIAAEIERETVVQSAAQPISRTGIFIGKWLASAKLFTIFNIVINAAVVPLCHLFNVTYLPDHFLAVTVMGELFGLALLSLSLAVSAFMSDKGRVQMIMAGAVLVMYVMNIVAAIKPAIDKLKYASLFHYFDPNKALIQGRYDITAIIVFGGLIVIGFAIGWWRFSKRDLV